MAALLPYLAAACREQEVADIYDRVAPAVVNIYDITLQGRVPGNPREGPQVEVSWEGDLYLVFEGLPWRVAMAAGTDLASRIAALKAWQPCPSEALVWCN